jgi:hypothetical protein
MLALENHSSLLYPFVSYAKMKYCEYAPGAIFTTVYFLCNLQIGPISQSIYYITVGCKCLPEKNTLAYWIYTYVTKKMKFCKYGFRGHIRNSLLSSQLTN